MQHKQHRQTSQNFQLQGKTIDTILNSKKLTTQD